MSINIREDSLYKFADPWEDEQQKVMTWGIADPPDPTVRDDDLFYTVRQGERVDLLAYRVLGSPRYFWVILHYNGMSNAFDIQKFVGQQIRLPSKQTLQRIYLNASE